MIARPPAAPPLIPSPETDLAAFAWLVAFVLTGFLILARVSQGTVDGEDDGPDRSGFEFDRSRGADESSRDADGAGADESSPVAHPLAPDGAVGWSPDEDDRGAAKRDGPRVTGRDEHRAAGHGDSPVAGPRAAEPPRMSPGLLLLNVALTQGLFGAILAGGAWYFGVPLPTLGISGDALSTGLPALAVGIGFGLVLWVGNELASGLAASSGADYDEGLRELLAPDGPRAWGLLLGATLPVIAVVEEFVFRAAVVGATTAALGVSPWLLAVVSSVAFALGHGAQGRVGIAVTGALGFALAAGFVLTNSLLVVVVAHYLVNALEFLVHEGFGLPDPVWS
ncbi:CPBP family intramembrane glutamic endopeptidase [Halosimplex sp. J119]